MLAYKHAVRTFDIKSCINLSELLNVTQSENSHENGSSIFQEASLPALHEEQDSYRLHAPVLIEFEERREQMLGEIQTLELKNEHLKKELAEFKEEWQK
jgi:hypothetical protein